MSVAGDLVRRDPLGIGGQADSSAHHDGAVRGVLREGTFLKAKDAAGRTEKRALDAESQVLPMSVSSIELLPAFTSSAAPAS